MWRKLSMGRYGAKVRGAMVRRCEVRGYDGARCDGPRVRRLCDDWSLAPSNPGPRTRTLAPSNVAPRTFPGLFTDRFLNSHHTHRPQIERANAWLDHLPIAHHDHRQPRRVDVLLR